MNGARRSKAAWRARMDARRLKALVNRAYREHLFRFVSSLPPDVRARIAAQYIAQTDR